MTSKRLLAREMDRVGGSRTSADFPTGGGEGGGGRGGGGGGGGGGKGGGGRVEVDVEIRQISLVEEEVGLRLRIGSG